MQTETSGKRAVGWTLGGTLLIQIVTKLVVGGSHHDQKSSTPGCPTSGRLGTVKCRLKVGILEKHFFLV